MVDAWRWETHDLNRDDRLIWYYALAAAMGASGRIFPATANFWDVGLVVQAVLLGATLLYARRALGKVSWRETGIWLATWLTTVMVGNAITGRPLF